jgi:hypothetical protein
VLPFAVMAIMNWRLNAAPKTPDVEVLDTRPSDETVREDEPKALAERGWAYWGVVLLDIILALVPALFIG